jgi:hypothetical protein
MMMEQQEQDHALARPELDLLKTYIDGCLRAWAHEGPGLEELIAAEGNAREALVLLVQEYFLRAVSYGEAIWLLLDRHLAVAFFPLLRSLYESHVAMRYLSTLNEGEQLREAQIASVHHWYFQRYRVRKRIGRPKELPTDKAELSRIEERIGVLLTQFPAATMSEAENRQKCYSWTGKNVSELLDTFGLASDNDKTYSPLSTLTHGHHILITEAVVRWTPEDYELRAKSCRSHLRAIRRLAQDILHRAFSDASIDSYTPGDVLELRYPHGWFKVPRP